ncbi:MAG TPA: OmpA family protein [Spirochaetota bacterium]|nr:OmpA family protein [Spirochaetota bacterium]HNT10069.1 OmpA family protein [Spirochaetota bacterium]HOS38963.1 OmpA family protein [Spirochaetota bacterium]
MRNIAVIATLLVFIVACSAKRKENPPDPAALTVQEINAELAKVSVVTFEYKSVALEKKEIAKWGEGVYPIIRDAIAKLPKGYVLQITGHADASGPEDVTSDKRGNVYWSTERAMAAWQYLRGKGITSPQMTFKGVGSTDLIEGVDARDRRQRRITFKIIKEQQ